MANPFDNPKSKPKRQPNRDTSKIPNKDTSKTSNKVNSKSVSKLPKSNKPHPISRKKKKKISQSNQVNSDDEVLTPNKDNLDDTSNSDNTKPEKETIPPFTSGLVHKSLKNLTPPRDNCKEECALFKQLLTVYSNSKPFLDDISKNTPLVEKSGLVIF